MSSPKLAALTARLVHDGFGGEQLGQEMHSFVDQAAGSSHGAAGPRLLCFACLLMSLHAASRAAGTART